MSTATDEELAQDLAVTNALRRIVHRRCYSPDCNQPIVRYVDRQALLNANLVPIKSLDSDHPRYDDRLKAATYTSFSNALLLCEGHRVLLQSATDQPSVAMLRAWKARAEGADRRLVGHLAQATADTFRELVAGLTANVGEVDAILDGLAVSDPRGASIIRSLVDAYVGGPAPGERAGAAEK